MTATPAPRIGFDRKVEIDWLDVVASRLAAGDSPDEVRAALDIALTRSLSSAETRGAKEKTTTVVTRVWMTVHPDVQPLRDAALRAFESATATDRIALHWAMCCATYPFFGDVVSGCGKLMALTGSCSQAQLRRRMAELWGDRSTVSWAMQRVMRSMLQWGAVRVGKKRGEYEPLARRIPVLGAVADVLVEALAAALRRPIAVPQVASEPALFPFAVQVYVGRLRANPRLDVHRGGDRVDYIEWRRGRT